MNKKLLYVLSSIVAVALIAVGTALLLTKVAPKNDTSDTQGESVTLSSLTGDFKTVLKNASNVTVIEAHAASPTAVLYPLGDHVWAGIDEGSTFLSMAAEGASVEAVATYAADVEKVLAERDFKARGDMRVSEPASLSQYFSSDDITCTVTRTTKGSPTLLYINCAHISAFAKSIGKTAPFVAAYKAAGIKGKDVLLVNPEIQNSGTKDYKYGVVNYSLINETAKGAEALFYQLPDKTWHFFTVAEDREKIPCSDFKTDELVNAFIGFICYDTSLNSSSYVLRPNPTFEVVPGEMGG